MAQLQQERHSEYVSGTAEQFVVTNLMLSASIPSELPHLNVFVMTINDRTSAKPDTLARVARISDLSNLPIGRDAALAAKAGVGLEYLSSTVRVAYPTLDEAETAATSFVDRVSALVTSWQSFQTKFNAPSPTPAVITIPSAAMDQLQALINAYAAAKQARYTAQTTKATADAAVTSAQSAVTAAQAAVTSVQGFLTSANTVKTEMSTLSSAFNTLKSAGDTVLPSVPAGAAYNTFQAALVTAGTQQTVDSGYVTDANNAWSALNTYLGTLNTNLTNANAALTTAQANQITAAQTLTSDQATETAALNAVLAVCPDFDSHTVPLVPG